MPQNGVGIQRLAPGDTPVRYRPAAEFPPTWGATEQLASSWGYTLPSGGGFVALNTGTGFNTNFIVPAFSWGRIDLLIFNANAVGAYLGVPGQGLAFQLTNNGVPIPGYDNILADAPQSDTVSSKTIVRATLVIPPGSQSLVQVLCSNFTGGNLNYVSALVRGWTWSASSNDAWKTGTTEQ